jgi:hypothetical protein
VIDEISAPVKEEEFGFEQNIKERDDTALIVLAINCSEGELFVSIEANPTSNSQSWMHFLLNFSYLLTW